MELMILDKNFRNFSVIDRYKSMIWTDRYSKYGDFELYLPANVENLQQFQNDYYLWSEHSNHLMIIEGRKIESDVEEGEYLTITGRSLESILDRRIIWYQTTLDGYLEGQIQKLINENVINPANQNRKISNFVFADSGNSYIKGLKIEGQYTGDNLYETLVEICASHNVGFSVLLNNKNQFEFKLYQGENRSYDQNKNPYVVFSPNFENIINSNYFESKKDFKNVSLVAGEGEGSERKTLAVGLVDVKDLDRREMYTDARDISSKTGDVTLTPEQYNNALKQRGEEKLSENKAIHSFDGKVESSQMYKYGEDFSMGDIVVFENRYGVTTNARITEFIYSNDTSGQVSYPTFEVIEEV